MSIYKKASDNMIEFDNGEDFLKYYDKNKITIDEIPTRGLNLKYKINGYKIGRKDGKIILWPNSNINSKSTSNKITIEDLKEIKEINDIFERLNICEMKINSLCAANQYNCDLDRKPEMNKKINSNNVWLYN